MTTKRTKQQQNQDRQTLRSVLEDADGWVTFGYIISRVDAGSNQTKRDLRLMLEAGTYQVVKSPGLGRGNKTKWAHMNNVRDEAALQMRQGDISAAVDAVTPRGRRRVSKATHPNRCMAWLPAEVQQLVDEVRSGMTLAEMAHEHGRTEKAIESRLYALSREGRIAWTTRTGTPRVSADRESSDFIKTVSKYDAVTEKPQRMSFTQALSFAQRAARFQALHTCVGAFLNGTVTLDGLASAYDACADGYDNEGDAE